MRAAEITAAFDRWIADEANAEYFGSELFTKRCEDFDRFLECGGFITVAGAAKMLGLPVEVTVFIVSKAAAKAAVGEAAMSNREGVALH